MPNIAVPATAEGMPKFNKAQIMRDAWSIYRRRCGGGRPATEQGRRKEFSISLKNAWEWARREQIEARKSLAEKAADRVRELTNELMRMDAQPWGFRGYRNESRRAAIHAEISAIQKGTLQ